MQATAQVRKADNKVIAVVSPAIDAAQQPPADRIFVTIDLDVTPNPIGKTYNAATGTFT